MKVLYLAKHGSGGNDDEGAISFALSRLGCEVIPLQEKEVHRCGEILAQGGFDFLLCHHLHNIQALTRLDVVKVAWCFDLIDWQEPQEWVTRHEQRRAWASAMKSAVDLMFCTDGDWALKNDAIWLMQGADEREVAKWSISSSSRWDVLFVGGGKDYGRKEFVESLRETYGDRFKHIERGCHGSALNEAVLCSKVVVCPPQPVTDRYWSNRIYNMCRLGAYVIHPRAAELEASYDYQIETYGTPKEMHALIRFALSRSETERFEYCRYLQEHTLKVHTYRHRCEKILERVKGI